jgi:hypothetical protein
VKLPFGRWRLPDLLLGWTLYWVTLVTVTLGPGILAAVRAVRAGNGSAINAGMSDGVVSATVIHTGVTTWTASESILMIAFWFAGPPLLWWLVWLIGGTRARMVADVPELIERGDLDELRRRTREEERQPRHRS